jgi:hypothetical protein
MKIFENGNQKLENRLAALESIVLKDDEKISQMERRIAFLIVPILADCLQEGIFSHRRGIITQHPIVQWVIARLRISKLSEEGRNYLGDLLSKVDLEQHSPLKL